MSNQELLARLRRLEDREAIRDLHNQYCFIQDRGHTSHAESDVAAFLGMLVEKRNVAAGTQNQAMAAILFLYRHVLGVPLSLGRDITRAKRPKRVPVVMTEDEVWRVLGEMSGVERLAAMLMYGSGLRLRECLTLRVKPGKRRQQGRVDVEDRVVKGANHDRGEDSHEPGQADQANGPRPQFVNERRVVVLA